jgi:ElaB/YqjD/DUF883 family membrane-anchored ribosome-binding protein
MAETPAEDVETLKKDLRKLQQDWDSLVSSTQHVLREGTRTGMIEARAEMEALRERLDEMRGLLGDRSQQAMESMRANVQKQPLTSLGVAFSVGALFALLMGSRR